MDQYFPSVQALIHSYLNQDPMPIIRMFQFEQDTVLEISSNDLGYVVGTRAISNSAISNLDVSCGQAHSRCEVLTKLIASLRNVYKVEIIDRQGNSEQWAGTETGYRRVLFSH